MGVEVGLLVPRAVVFRAGPGGARLSRRARSAAALALALIALGGCGDDTAADAGPDAAADAADAGSVELTAVPDPAELTDCLASPPAEGEIRAKHITCEDELMDGPLAMGRLGDIVIESSRARFIIRTGEESATLIGAYAGTVVDAAEPGGIDQLKELFPVVDLSGARPEDIVVTSAGGEEAVVRVLFSTATLGIVQSTLGGAARPVAARGVIDYVLEPDATALQVRVQLTTRDDVAGTSGRPGLLAFLGGALEVVQPGNDVLGDDTSAGNSASAAIVAESATGALALVVSGPGGTVGHADSINLVIGADRLQIRQGELVGFDGRLAVGATAADAYAAALEGAEHEVLTLTGTAGDRAEVRQGDAVMLRTRLDASGEARVPLPAGNTTVRRGFDGFFADGEQSVDVGPGGATLAVDPPPSATLTVQASVEGEPGAPVRATVSAGGEALVFRPFIDEATLRLPPGDYRVTVSRGMEHDIVEQDVTLADGGEETITAALHRVLDTAGWIACDFHLHSEMSTDSTHPVEAKVLQLAAEGLELVASTDHDFITDYATLAERAGIGGLIVTVPGSEVSTTGLGHFGGYPLARDPDRAGFGAPVWFDLTPRQIFDAIRAQRDDAFGEPIVQVNHPRLRGSSFFDRVALDPETGHATATPAELGLSDDTDLDDFAFDVIEVWNGYTRGDNEASFEDYLGLAAAGRRFTMVGNSDSHSPDVVPGSPRTYLAVSDDAPGAYGWDDAAAALRSGSATVAAGILVEASVTGRSGDDATVAVRVQAPPWVEVDRLKVYAGRELVMEDVVDVPPADIIRFEGDLTVPLHGASFVVVRAEGDREPDPVIHFAPFGVTNPIDVP